MRHALDPVPTLPAQPSEAIRLAIEAMDGTLLLASALVESGRRIDLAGLDGEAARICAAVMTLDEANARCLRPALESLRERVNGLAGRLAEPD